MSNRILTFQIHPSNLPLVKSVGKTNGPVGGPLYPWMDPRSLLLSSLLGKPPGVSHMFFQKKPGLCFPANPTLHVTKQKQFPM